MLIGKIKQEFLSDYKKVDNLYFPFVVKVSYKNSSMKSTYLIKSIQLNPKIDNNIFVYPEKK